MNAWGLEIRGGETPQAERRKPPPVRDGLHRMFVQPGFPPPKLCATQRLTVVAWGVPAITQTGYEPGVERVQGRTRQLAHRCPFEPVPARPIQTAPTAGSDRASLKATHAPNQQRQGSGCAATTALSGVSTRWAATSRASAGNRPGSAPHAPLPSYGEKRPRRPLC
jgi:hypothetical protein